MRHNTASECVTQPTTASLSLSLLHLFIQSVQSELIRTYSTSSSSTTTVQSIQANPPRLKESSISERDERVWHARILTFSFYHGSQQQAQALEQRGRQPTGGPSRKVPSSQSHHGSPGRQCLRLFVHGEQQYRCHCHHCHQSSSK